MTVKTGYDRITGYKDIKAMLKKSVQKQKTSHAYVFCGEAGAGKTLIATTLAAAMLCEKMDGDACMECPSCRKVISKNHPDIKVMLHEKPESIGVGDVREQIIDDIYIKPFESGRKIYIIPDASMMTVQAQNAILKTLEEPPAYATLILLAENMDALLPTIVSRCTTVRLNPIDDELIYEYLKYELDIPEDMAAVYAAFSMGKIGIAKKLAISSDFTQKLNESLHYLRKSKDIDPIDRIEINKKLTQSKRDIYEYLDIFTIWFRDILLFKATKETQNIIMKEELSAIKKRASLSSYEGLQLILDSIETARIRLRANVNPELIMELLLLTISEN